MKRIILLSVITIFCSQYIFTSGTKKIVVRSYKDFSAGKLKGAAISSRDKLVLGIKTEKMVVPEEEFILSAAVSTNKTIFLGTGHNGRVYKITGGKTVEIFSSRVPDVNAVYAAKDGSVFFGTSPQGKVYRIDKRGKIKEFFNPEEKYIWDIDEDPAGNIICAVGGNGAVYRIDRLGNSKKILKSGDTHILSLYVSSSGKIYAGSSPQGILYEAGTGKVKIMNDTPYSDVRDICGDSKGNIYYLSTESAEKKIFDLGSMKNSIFSSSKKRSSSKVSKGYIYKLVPSGYSELFWIVNHLKAGSIYSILYDEKNSALLAGTSIGKLFRISGLSDYSLLYSGESDKLFRLVDTGNDFLMIFNNTSSIIRGSFGRTNKGSYISDVFDMKYFTKTGNIYWETGNGNDNGISFSVRAGNTNRPGFGWTDWSAPFEGPGSHNLGINGYKFLQIRINLRSTEKNRKPSISSFKYFFRQFNLEPLIVAINVGRKKKAPLKKVKTKSVKSNPVGIVISWLAVDPNDDELEYTVYLKKTGGKWIRVAENIKEKRFVLKNDLYEDGIYRVKVEADDHLSNSPEEMKSVHITSEGFIVDSLPPVLKNFKNVNGRVTFNAYDVHSIIRRVEYSREGKHWFPIFPADGISDSGIESYNVKISGLKGINKMLLIKITDESGNFRIYQKLL